MNYNSGSLIRLKDTGAIYLIIDKCRINFRYNAPSGLHGGNHDLNRSPSEQDQYLKLVSPEGAIEYAMFRGIVNNEYDPMMEDWMPVSV